MRRETWQLNFWRIWLPAVLCLGGITVMIIDGFNLFGIDAFSAFCGAGLSIALINFLWRLGIAGNQDRDVEEEARQYLAEHGHWPDDERREDPRP